MPFPQLLSATLEKSANHLLSLDPHSRTLLQGLKGKRLLLSLQELSQDLLLVFSEQIDVLCVDKQNADEKVTEAADCYIAVSVFTLTQLRDSNQLTQLIKQEKLVLEGDIQLAQQFSQLFLQLNIDWEEQLAQRSSDVFAHEVFRLGRGFWSKASQLKNALANQFRDAMLEEKNIAAPPVLVSTFAREVDDLAVRVTSLEQRLKRFEER